jgi:AbiU2
MNGKQQTLPAELANVFEELNQNISWLHANWLIFEQLFAAGEERVELLNEFAPIFFRLCQDSFSDNVILSIARLTDPPKSMGKDTLSFEQLISKVDPTKYPNLRSTLSQQCADLKACCKSIRDVRNRRLAHNDLHIALGSHSNLLPDILKDEIDDVLRRIRELMNTVWVYFNPDSELGYDVVMPNDGEAIILALEKAKKYREISRLRYGRI